MPGLTVCTEMCGREVHCLLLCLLIDQGHNFHDHYTIEGDMLYLLGQSMVGGGGFDRNYRVSPPLISGARTSPMKPSTENTARTLSVCHAKSGPGHSSVCAGVMSLSSAVMSLYRVVDWMSLWKDCLKWPPLPLSTLFSSFVCVVPLSPVSARGEMMTPWFPEGQHWDQRERDKRRRGEERRQCWRPLE